MAKLTKLSDDRFGGEHPNGIIQGYVKEGFYLEYPELGQMFFIAGMHTSTVTNIVSESPNEVIFKTRNSTYKLEP